MNESSTEAKERKNTGTILVADDEPTLRLLVETILTEAGYRVILAEGGDQALTLAEKDTFEGALVDLFLGDMNGIEVLEGLLKLDPDLPVMILTGHASIPDAVEAVKKGAQDFISKPFQAEDLLRRLEKAIEVGTLKREVTRLHRLVDEQSHFGHIITANRRMQEILNQVAQIARTDSTVCVYGESGTGKELVSKATHLASRRASGPFIAINCGAIPEGLLESELFGHVKGAFTGADRTRKGLVAQAHGGTLFLDEIGELPPVLQIKLLRVLQEREFYPVGSEQPSKVDMRLIVATNKDLEKKVSTGEFREDLYYRIHVIPIFLPPLRERKEDIPLLAWHFLDRFSRDLGKRFEGLSPEAVNELVTYNWPGNVRELANVMERVAVLCPGDQVGPDLPFSLGKRGTTSLREAGTKQHSVAELLPFTESRELFERDYLTRMLGHERGHVVRAAKRAGKRRSEFYRLLQKHGLDPATFRTSISEE